MDKLRTGRFVHVVGTVDLDAGEGKLLYVNPSTVTTSAEAAVATEAAGPHEPRFSLRIEGREGEELTLIEPAIFLPSDRHEGPRTGLIDQDIPFIDGMKRLSLLHDGRVVSEFQAGELEPASSKPSLQMGAAPPGQSEKRGIDVAGHDTEQPGVTYTVQVKPDGDTAWQTIAVGRPTAGFTLDRNQFPGVEKADVRVLRATGFEQDVVASEKVDLRFIK